MRPIVATVGPLAGASANAIALSQTPAAGNITINGALATNGVATMDNPREVLFTTSGNETGKTFTLYGTDWAGDAISETVAAPNVGTAASVLSYETVTQITISSGAAGALTVGTNGVGSSPWIRLDEWANPTVQVQCALSGTGNYTVQQSMDDPNSPTNPVSPGNMTWISWPVAALVGASTSQQSISTAPLFLRVLLNSGTGSVTITAVQYGAVPY